MSTFSPQFKHEILRQYVAGDRAHSFAALANRYNIRGGKTTVQYWHSHWDGTVSSLERKEGSGRRVLLTPQQVNKLIVKPIRRANRNHVAIDYPEVKDLVEQKTGLSISARSVRRYGREAGGIRSSTTNPRTEQESNIIYIFTHY